MMSSHSQSQFHMTLGWLCGLRCKPTLNIQAKVESGPVHAQPIYIKTVPHLFFIAIDVSSPNPANIAETFLLSCEVR